MKPAKKFVIGAVYAVAGTYWGDTLMPCVCVGAGDQETAWLSPLLGNVVSERLKGRLAYRIRARDWEPIRLMRNVEIEKNLAWAQTPAGKMMIAMDVAMHSNGATLSIGDAVVTTSESVPPGKMVVRTGWMTTQDFLNVNRGPSCTCGKSGMASRYHWDSCPVKGGG